MSRFNSRFRAAWRLLWALCVAALTPPALAQEIVITFGGDTNFAGSRQNPDPVWVRKWRTFTMEEATATLRPEWNGDVNFVNVESIVGDRNGAIQGKQFVFRSHPEQMRYLMAHGVNAFALANNHAWDHGWSGLEMTWDFFTAEDHARRPLLFAGIGAGEVAFRPKVITVKGKRIALASVGFGSGRFAPTANRIGMAYMRDYDFVLRALAETEADIKIISIHFGTENDIGLNFGQADLFRRAVLEAGAHLVIGHHPHVVRAVEARPDDNAAIFYSLGNYLFIGGAAKDNRPLGQDYGLMGKAYFRLDAQGEAVLSALEAIPLKGVHEIPVHPPPARAAATVDHLNGLSRRSVGEAAAVFSLINPAKPRGLACYGGPYGAKAQEQCCAVERSIYCDLPDLM
ncbi:MAG: CapA family protein [Pseudomonadota bacterium]